jgi:hypothetical protein
LEKIECGGALCWLVECNGRSTLTLFAGQGVRHTGRQKQDNLAIKIGDKLYMGSIQAAENADHLAALGITNILSVISSGHVKEDARFLIKTVIINDVENADLIAVLPECIEFIVQGMKRGGVLVHW